MSIEVSHDIEVEKEQDRLQILIGLARAANIQGPVQAAVDAEYILDGISEDEIIGNYIPTIGAYATALGIAERYEAAIGSTEPSDRVHSAQETAETILTTDPEPKKAEVIELDPERKRRRAPRKSKEEAATVDADNSDTYAYEEAGDLVENDSPKPHAEHAKDRIEVSVSRDDSDTEPFTSRDTVGQYLRQIGKVQLLKAEEEVELAKDIEAGLYAKHLLDTNDLKGFKKADLCSIARTGNASFERMLEANLRLVVWVTNRYKYGKSHLAFDDLIQHGNLGLMRSVQKFDYKKGNKFSTYATWWIKQAAMRAIHDEDSTIRLPVHVGEKSTSVISTYKNIEQERGTRPTYNEVADTLNMSSEQVRAIIESRYVDSLDRKIGKDGDGETLGSFLSSELLNEGNTYEEVEQDMIETDIGQRMQSVLSQQELDVFIRRQTEKLEDIASSYGITYERTRQVYFSAQAKLKHPSSNIGLLVHEQLEWHESAVCRSIGTDPFFPNVGGTVRGVSRICNDCPVKDECLDYALGEQVNYGVWGGMSARDRKKYKSDHKSDETV